nr:hypothetical protein [Tanacetum cinerariifolium]
MSTRLNLPRFHLTTQIETLPTKKKKATRNRKKRVNQAEPAPRQTAWTIEEEIALAKGWRSIFENSEHGNARKKDSFWVEVLEYVESKTEKEGRRTNVMRMAQESGAGDEDYIQNEMIHYQAECGLLFKFLHCWEVLKDSPKFQEIAFPNFNQGSQGSSKRHKSSGNSMTIGQGQSENKGSQASGSSTMNDDALARLMVTKMTATEVAQRGTFMELKMREVESSRVTSSIGAKSISKSELKRMELGSENLKTRKRVGIGVESQKMNVETIALGSRKCEFDHELKKVEELKQVASVKEYHDSFIDVLNRLQHPQRSSLSCFIDGLKEDIRFMVIDKSWTSLGKHEKAFYTGLKKFVDDCKPLVNSSGIIRCPCKSCRLVLWVSIKHLSCHISKYGFDPSYKTWIHHGEPDLPPPPPVIDNTRQPQMSDMTTCLNELSYIPLNNEQNEPTQSTHSADIARLKKREKLLTKQVNMFMRLFRSDEKFSQMLTQLESQPEYGGGSGSGGCGDDEPGDDEDGGKDEKDEDDS